MHYTNFFFRIFTPAILCWKCYGLRFVNPPIKS